MYFNPLILKQRTKLKVETKDLIFEHVKQSGLARVI